MRVLITGDRAWSDEQAVDVVLGGLLVQCRATNQTLEVLHGDCPTGADHMVESWKNVAGVEVVPFPADWAAHGKGAGPIRNRLMLDQEPDLVIAFHDQLEGVSKGTKDCTKEAARRGIRVWHLRHLPG